MKVEYDSLTIENFGPYRGKQTLRFGGRKGSPPVTLVDGKNGFGKTSLLGAFNWLLYGEDDLTKRKALVNRAALEAGENKTKVNLQFVRGSQNHNLLRELTLNPGGSVAEKLVYLIDGEPQLNPRSRIRELLPQQASQFFFFDGAKIGRYADLENTREVRDAIEMVLGLPAYSNAVQHLDRLKARWEAELRKANTSNEAAKEHVQKAERARTELKSVQDAMVREKGRTQDLQKGIEDLKGKMTQYEALRDRLQGLENAQARLDAAKDQLEARRKLQAQAIRSITHRALLPLLEKQLTDQETELKGLEKRRDRVEGRRHVLEFLGSLKGIEAGTVKELRTKADQKYPESDGVGLEGIHGKHEQVGRLKDQCSVIKAYEPFEALGVEFQKARTKLAQAEQEVRDLRQGLGENVDHEEARELQAKHDQLLTALGGAREELSNLERLQEGFQKEADEADKAIRKFAKGTDSARLGKLIELAGKLGNAFEVMLDRTRVQKRSLIQAEATELFLQLTRKPGVYDKFRINDDYTLSLLDRRGVEHPRDQISAGEKQLVALSFIVGLMKSTERVVPLVIDTPFGHLDLQHRQQVIQNLPSFEQQLVLCVTDADLAKPEHERDLRQHVGAKFVIDYDDKEQASSLREVKA